MILSFTIASKIGRSLTAFVAILGFPAFAVAGDWEIPPGLTLPVQYGITGGQVVVTVTHPFRILKMENRSLHGDISIEAGEKHPSASFKAFLGTDGFRSSSANIREIVENILGSKRNSELGFVSQSSEIQQGRKAGVSEVAFLGDLALGDTHVEWTAPLSCAISPDLLSCRFNIPFRLHELRLAPPAPLGIPFDDNVTIEGEWVATRRTGS